MNQSTMTSETIQSNVRRPGCRPALQGGLRPHPQGIGGSDRRPERRHRAGADRHLRPRPCPLGRRAGPGQDAAGQLAGRGHAPGLQAHPVHARPDAQRRHRHADHPGGSGDAAAAVPVPARAAVRQHDPGRRNQPHAAEDPGRHARGDAGAADQFRRAGPPPARPVLRPGHAESAGAGRHLSAARGPVGPFSPLHQGRLSQSGRGMGDRPAGHHRHAGPDHALA